MKNEGGWHDSQPPSKSTLVENLSSSVSHLNEEPLLEGW